jgi:hypothetical protein
MTANQLHSFLGNFIKNNPPDSDISIRLVDEESWRSINSIEVGYSELGEFEVLAIVVGEA